MLDFTKSIYNKDPSLIYHPGGSFCNENSLLEIYSEELIDLKYKLLLEELKNNMNDKFKLCALLSILEVRGTKVLYKDTDDKYKKIPNMDAYIFDVIDYFLSPNMISILEGNDTQFTKNYFNILYEDPIFKDLYEYIKNVYKDITNKVNDMLLSNITRYCLEPLVKANHTITNIEYITSRTNLLNLKSPLFSTNMNDREYENGSSINDPKIFFNLFFTYLSNYSENKLVKINRNILGIAIDTNGYKMKDKVKDSVDLFKCNIDGIPSLVLPLIFFNKMYLKIINNKYPLHAYELMFKFNSICFEDVCMPNIFSDMEALNNKYNLKDPKDIYNSRGYIVNLAPLKNYYTKEKDLTLIGIYSSQRIWKFPFTIIYSTLSSLFTYLSTNFEKYLLDNELKDEENNFSIYKPDNDSFKICKLLYKVYTDDLSGIFNDKGEIRLIKIYVQLCYVIHNLSIRLFSSNGDDIVVHNNPVQIFSCLEYTLENNKVKFVEVLQKKGYRFEFKSKIYHNNKSGEMIINPSEYVKYTLEHSSIVIDIQNKLQELVNNYLSTMNSYKEELTKLYSSYNDRFNPILYNGDFNNFLEEIKYVYPELYERADDHYINKIVFEKVEYPLEFVVKPIKKSIEVYK